MITFEVRDGEGAGTVITVNDVEDVVVAYRCHGDGAWRVMTRGPFSSLKESLSGLAGKAMTNPAILGLVGGLFQRHQAPKDK